MQSFSEQLGLPGTQPGVRDGYQHQSQTYRGFGQQHQQQSPSPLPSPAAGEYFNPQPPYHGYFNHLGNYYYAGAKPTSQLQQQQQQQQQQQPTGLSGYGLSLDSTFPGQYSSESMVQWRGPRSTPLSFPVYEQDRFGGPFSPPPPSFQPSSGGSSVNRSLQQQHSGGPLSLGPQSPSPSPLSQRSPLPHHQAPSLPHHQAPSLPHHQAPSLPHHQTPSLPHHQAPSLPHHQATPLPHHQAAPLPHQQATPLPHHQPGPHSHHSTSIQQHLAQPTVQLQQQQQQQQPQQPTSPQYNQSGLPFPPHYQPHSSTSFPTQSYSPKYHSLSVAQYDSQVSGFCGGSFGSSSTLFNYQQGTVLQGFEQPSSPQKQQQQISSQANATLSQTPNQVGLYSSLELSVKSPSQFHHQPFSPSSVPSPALQPVGRSPSYSSASASSPALQSPDPTHFLSGGIRGPMTQLLHSPSPSTSMSGGQYKPIPGVECHVSAEPNNSLDIGTERIQPKPATMASLDPSIVRLDVRRCLEAPIDSELNRPEREMPTACTQENSMALNLKVSPGCLDGRTSGDTSSGVGDVCSRLDSMSSLNALSSQVENIPKTVQQLLLSEALALHRRGGKRSPRRADASRERGSSTDSSVRSSCSSSPLATERLHALEEADSDKECLPKQNASLTLKSESMDIIPVAWPVETTRTCSVISSDISSKDFLSDDSKAHSLAFPVHDEIKTKHIIGPDGNITRDIASKPCLDVASEDGLLDNQCVSIKDEASKIASDVTPFKCVRVISSPLEVKDNKDLRWAEQHLEDMQEAKYASNEQMRHAPQDSSGMLLQSKLETDNGKSHTEADCDASIINGDSGSVHQRSIIVSEVMENPPVVMKGSKREISKCRKQDVINLQNEVDVLGTKGPAVHGSILKLTPLSTPPTGNRRSLRPNKKMSIHRDLDSKAACHQKPFTCTGGGSEASIQLQSFPSNSNLICNVDSSHSQYSEEVLRGSNNMVGPLKKLPGRNGGRLPTGTERRSYVRKPNDTVVSRRTSAANANSPSVAGNAAQRHVPTNTASSSTPLEEIASARGITTMARRAGRQVPVVTERKLSRETTAVSRGSNQLRGSCSEQAVRRRRTSTMMEGDVKIDTSLLVSATCSSSQSNKALGNLISEDSVLNTTRISPRRVGNVAFLQGVSDENRQQPHGKECEEKVNFTRPSTTDHRISPVTLSHVQEPVYRQQGSRRKQMPSLKQDASLTKRLEGKMGEAVPCPTGVNTYDATSKRKSREKTEATVKKQRIELEPNNLIQAEGNTKNCSNVHVRQTLFNAPNPGKTKILPPRKSRGLKLEEIVQKITSPKRLAPPNILEVTNNSASLEELLTGNSDVSEEQSAVGKERKPPRCSPNTLFNTSGENGGSVIQGVSVSLENRDLGRVAYPTGQALSFDGKLKQESKVTTRIPSLPKENFLTLLKPNLPKPICSLLPISASVTTGRSENEHALPSSSHRPQLSVGSNHTSALTSVYTRPSSRGTTARLCNKAPAVQTSASNHTGRLRPVGPALGSIRAPVVVVPQATMPTVRFIDSLLDSRAGDTSNSARNKSTSSRKVSPPCIPALTSSKVTNVSPSIKALPSNVVPVVRVPGVLTKDGKVDNIATALLNTSHCKTKNLSSSCAVKEVSVISSPSKDRRKRSRGSGPKRGALSKKRNSRSKKSLLIMAQPDEPEIRLKSLCLKNEEKPESRVKYFSPYIRMQNNCRESIITIVNSQDDELKLEKPKSALRSSIPKPMPQVLPSSSCVVIARVVTDAPNKGPLVCCICGFSANWKDLGDIFGPYYPQGYQPSRKNKPTDKECDLSKVVEEKVERVEETSHEIPRSCLTEAENESRGRRRSSCQGRIRRDSNSACPPGRGGLRGTRCRKPTCYCCREGLEGGGSSSTGAVDPRSRKAKVEGATKEMGVIVSPVTTVETSQPPEVPLDCQEYWVHCACAVWTGEVFLIAGRLYGLQEAVEMAQETSCTRCGQSGASLGCNFKGCLQRYHFVCASEAECLLCEENFTMKCAKHKGKMLLAAADSLEKR